MQNRYKEKSEVQRTDSKANTKTQRRSAKQQSARRMTSQYKPYHLINDSSKINQAGQNN